MVKSLPALSKAVPEPFKSKAGDAGVDAAIRHPPKGQTLVGKLGAMSINVRTHHASGTAVGVPVTDSLRGTPLQMRPRKNVGTLDGFMAKHASPDAPAKSDATIKKYAQEFAARPPPESPASTAAPSSDEVHELPEAPDSPQASQPAKQGFKFKNPLDTIKGHVTEAKQGFKSARDGVKEAVGDIKAGEWTKAGNKLQDSRKAWTGGISHAMRAAAVAQPVGLIAHLATNGKSDEFVGRVHKDVTDTVDKIYDGAGNVTGGIVHGDRKQFAQGARELAEGATDAVQLANPEGFAMNAAGIAVTMGLEKTQQPAGSSKTVDRPDSSEVEAKP